MNENNAAQAIQEAERNTAVQEYFGYRAWLKPTPANFRLFEAGFDRAYALLSKLRAPVADERAAFEAAMMQRGQNVDRWPNPHGGYRNSRTEIAWYAWNDRAALASAPVAGEALTRFCPECGHVGDVGNGYRSCCPDGGSARMVPKSLADKCRATFQLAIKSDAAPQASEEVRDAALLARALDLLERNKPFYGQIGSRDVDVGAALKDWDEITAAMRAALSAQPGAQKPHPKQHNDGGSDE